MNLDLATLAHEGLRGIITNAKQQHRLYGLVISTLAELYERHHTCCAKLAALCCTLWSWCVCVCTVTSPPYSLTSVRLVQPTSCQFRSLLASDLLTYVRWAYAGGGPVTENALTVAGQGHHELNDRVHVCLCVCLLCPPVFVSGS